MKYSRIYTAMHGVCTDAFHWRIVVESLNKTDRYSVSSVVILRVDPSRYFVNVRFCEFLSFSFFNILQPLFGDKMRNELRFGVVVKAKEKIVN